MTIKNTVLYFFLIFSGSIFSADHIVRSVASSFAASSSENKDTIEITKEEYPNILFVVANEKNWLTNQFKKADNDVKGKALINFANCGRRWNPAVNIKEWSLEIAGLANRIKDLNGVSQNTKHELEEIISEETKRYPEDIKPYLAKYAKPVQAISDMKTIKIDEDKYPILFAHFNKNQLTPAEAIEAVIKYWITPAKGYHISRNKLEMATMANRLIEAGVLSEDQSRAFKAIIAYARNEYPDKLKEIIEVVISARYPALSNIFTKKQIEEFNNAYNAPIPGGTAHEDLEKKAELLLVWRDWAINSKGYGVTCNIEMIRLVNELLKKPQALSQETIIKLQKYKQSLIENGLKYVDYIKEFLLNEKAK
ncbi:MAG: hypothetical protein P4L22_06820 [Candidatus Babeliales bacterium]|nr:hypothetical protein [Candidatus Babeliales bacterium]